MRFGQRFYMQEQGGEGGAGGGGAAGDKGAAGGGAGDKGGGDALAAANARIAALEAAAKAGEDAATKAKTDAAAAAEVDRVAKLTADQKVQEELAKQRGDLDATKTALVTERRDLALERLGVVDKFKAFAPAADPKDPAGAKALEAWAKANPELLKPTSANGGAAPTVFDELKQKAGSALQKVLSGERKSTLVTARNLSKLQ